MRRYSRCGPGFQRLVGNSVKFFTGRAAARLDRNALADGVDPASDHERVRARQFTILLGDGEAFGEQFDCGVAPVGKVGLDGRGVFS